MTDGTEIIPAGFLVVILLILLIPVVQADSSTKPSGMILVSWEGTGYSDLTDLLSDGELPALSRVLSTGSLVTISVTDHQTDPLSGHSEMVTGYAPETTGVYTSFRHNLIPAGYSVQERVKDALGNSSIDTAIFAGRERSLGTLPGLPLYNAARAADYYLARDDDADMMASAAAEALFQIADNERFFFFLQFRDAGFSGIQDGANRSTFRDAIRGDDAALLSLLDTLDTLDLSGSTLILVTSVNGFSLDRRTKDDQGRVWLACSEPLSATSGDQKDIAPTILDLFGIDYRQFSPPYPGISLV